MGQSRATLVRQMQEALRGEAAGRGVPGHAIVELHTRIQRLKSRDAKFAGVRLSPEVARRFSSELPA